jgi:hypothetical protein
MTTPLNVGRHRRKRPKHQKLCFPDEKGAEMISKHSKGAKVIRKTHHGGDSRNAIGMRSRGAVLRSVYKRLENRPILLPAIRPDTDGRDISAAVKAVVTGSKK